MSASADSVTVGSPLTQSFEPASIEGLVTLANLQLPEAGAYVASPISGTIVRWHLLDAEGGPFRLRVLRPSGGGYAQRGQSAAEVPAGRGLQTFATSLSISAGDLIALENGRGEGDEIGIAEPPDGGEAAIWDRSGEERAGLPEPTESEAVEVAFNAEVQPPPWIFSVSPVFGSTSGGTRFAIRGSDLEGATAVTFGETPVPSFTVDSEQQITAVVPGYIEGSPFSHRRGARVTVTTPSGSAKRSFSYEACLVPVLEGTKLAEAKSYVSREHCAVGTARRGRGVQGDLGRVVAQEPEPNTLLPVGSTVNVRLKLEREEGCYVPKLLGLPLRRARAALKAAKCGLGRVTREKGATARTGRVFRQHPKPGRLLDPHSKVSVGLRE